MTNQQVLEKARNKAIKNGWAGSPFIDNANDYAKLLQSKITTDIVYGDNWWELVVLFMPPHDFAKALWKDVDFEDFTTYHKNSEVEYRVEAWKFHLMNMVVADDPIKYLEENL